MGNPKTVRLSKIRRVPKIPGGPDIGPASSKLGPVHLKKGYAFLTLKRLGADSRSLSPTREKPGEFISPVAPKRALQG